MSALEDDLCEILLLSLRLATTLSMPDERRLFARSLRNCGLSARIVERWSQPPFDTETNVPEILAAIGQYHGLIHALPDLFQRGLVGSAFQNVITRAGRIAPDALARLYPANGNLPPTDQNGEMISENFPFWKFR